MKKIIKQPFLNRNRSATLFTLLVIILFVACEPIKTFNTQYGEVCRKDFTKISIVISQGKQNNTISITNKDSINSFVNDLSESKIDGPWKGAIWDEIVLIGKDTTITLSTNGNVFGFGSSGFFYKLNDKYKRFWNLKE